MSVEPVTEPAAAPPVWRWYHRFSALLFIVFCLEVGMFLLLIPWYGELWHRNVFATMLPRWPAWHHVWDSAWFRGAVSGMGLLNIYVSLVEIFRFRRFFHGR